MPWPTARMIFDVAGEGTYGPDETIDPPADAEACYVSVDSPEVRLFFEDAPSVGTRPAAGMKLHPGKQPYFFPFAKRMRFSDGDATISVLWLRLRYPPQGEQTTT